MVSNRIVKKIEHVFGQTGDRPALSVQLGVFILEKAGVGLDSLVSAGQTVDEGVSDAPVHLVGKEFGSVRGLFERVYIGQGI